MWDYKLFFVSYIGFCDVGFDAILGAGFIYLLTCLFLYLDGITHVSNLGYEYSR